MRLIPALQGRFLLLSFFVFKRHLHLYGVLTSRLKRANLQQAELNGVRFRFWFATCFPWLDVYVGNKPGA